MFSEPSHPHPTTQNSMEISLRMMLDPNGFKKKKKKCKFYGKDGGWEGKLVINSPGLNQYGNQGLKAVNF
jgi:hypothetical protein